MQKNITLIIIILITSIINNSYAFDANIIETDIYTDTETHFFNENGKRLFLDQYEGKTVLLVFWATWCESCVHELPILDNLQKDFRKLPFKVIALSQDSKGVELIKDYFTKNDIRHLDIFHDYKNKLFRSMSVAGLPTAFLINSQGKIKKIFKGRVMWQTNEIRDILLSEIDGNFPMPKNSYRVRSLNMHPKNAPSNSIESAKKENSNEQKAKSSN